MSMLFTPPVVFGGWTDWIIGKFGTAGFIVFGSLFTCMLTFLTLFLVYFVLGLVVCLIAVPVYTVFDIEERIDRLTEKLGEDKTEILCGVISVPLFFVIYGIGATALCIMFRIFGLR